MEELTDLIFQRDFVIRNTLLLHKLLWWLPKNCFIFLPVLICRGIFCYLWICFLDFFVKSYLLLIVNDSNNNDFNNIKRSSQVDKAISDYALDGAHRWSIFTLCNDVDVASVHSFPLFPKKFIAFCFNLLYFPSFWLSLEIIIVFSLLV